MKKISLVLATLVLQSCSHNGGRNIASQQLSPPDFSNFLKASEQILEDVQSDAFISDCVPYLLALEKTVDQLDIKSYPKGELLKDANQIAENSWQSRVKLHERLDKASRECAIQMQSNFRQFRFVEDYVLELAQQVPHMMGKDIDFQHSPIPMKESAPSYVFKTANGDKELKLQAGDMLVTRGVSFLSGMIARLGRRNTQFSHIVWVTKDSETGEFKTIESYVGAGVASYDMDFALKNENARILWLRAKDQDLAKKADELIAKRVKEKHIVYDYSLDFDDNSTMSCAEVSQVAFKMASDGKMIIPFYPNEISGAQSLITRLKIKPGPTYEPGDMEIDPRFELVGEFQDLRLTRDSRHKDAIMTAMFQWMNTYGYELHDSMKSKLAGGLIYKIRRTFMWPLVKKMLKLDEFSKEIPPNMLRTVTLMNQLGEVLQKELKDKDDAYQKLHGVPMTAMEFEKVLEDFRKKDFDLYRVKKTKKESQFHKWFHPPKTK